MENGKRYTSKQMGDACEMLVAAELTLAGVPAMKAPDYWPGCDVIAQPSNQSSQRVSVKSRTFKRGAAFVRYSASDVFDWLAIVLLPGEDSSQRRLFVIPRIVADQQARKYATERTVHVREYRIDEVAKKFAAYEGNFTLSLAGGEYSPVAVSEPSDSQSATLPAPDSQETHRQLTTNA